MSISYFPTPPTRVDTLNFRERADAFLSQFNQFVEEANANTNYLTAVASAVVENMNTTIANATAAQGFANAVKWVSGTTYTQGSAVYSPANYQTYRRITNGAGTTDPSLDETNWVNIQVPIPTIAYDSRATVRGLAPYDGQVLFIESIGLMRFFVSSSEIDDDETCFATSTGNWILECPHWDLIDAMREPDDINQMFPQSNTFVVMVNVSFSDINLSATGPLTQISMVTVPGALPGDTVNISPALFDPTDYSFTTGITCKCMVSVPNNVKVILSNFTTDQFWLKPGLYNFTITHKNY